MLDPLIVLPPPLLCLPGGLGTFELMEDAIAALRKRREVRLYSIPPDADIDAVCDGIIASLDSSGVTRIDLLGHSFGGYLAQCFARRHPDRVRYMVLSHSYLLDKRDIGRLQKGSVLGKMMPRWLFHWALRAKGRIVLRPVRRHRPADYERIRAVMDVILSEMTIAKVRHNNQLMTQAFTRCLSRPASGDVPRTLIIEPDADPVLGKAAQKQLRAAFPAASIERFRGTGHATPTARPDEYARLVNAFLSE
jgi:pimeloyl-ACP methyl ester carboxylesterase